MNPIDLFDAGYTMYADIIARREEYIRAWIAEKGYWPSKMELVEENWFDEENNRMVYRTIVRLRG